MLEGTMGHSLIAAFRANHGKARISRPRPLLEVSVRLPG